MPNLTDHEAISLVKLLLIGDPGTGKTGSLVSLVKAGYKLRIYDFDNLLGSLIQFVKHEALDQASNVSYQTFTDKMKGIEIPLVMNGGSAKVLPFLDGQPRAYLDFLKQLNHWKTPSEDLGVPSSWGADTVVVVDSLTSVSQAAFRFAQATNPGAKEPQTYYFSAQQLIMNLLYLLASKDFATNVIVLAHLDYDKDKEGNLIKGFPRSIGSAINSQIGGSFNSILQAERVGSIRQIRTKPVGIIDLKNPVPFKLPETLPIGTGLADFFQAVKS